ncbi:hypothetical protein [Arthrobacter sp. 18067]|uniref:hypothetical protein n=1 Tax=Arthrobacter sp. 18067 TaxID=2681413 RepID=UPI00135B167D|nr:hypothetical protein [Arthrobacter sp. 18067]
MTSRRLEDEVESLLVEAYTTAFNRQPSDDWRRAMAMRVGTAGDVSTLDEAGAEIGVTRERVRQVMARIEPELKGATVHRAKDVAEALAARSPVPEPIGRRLARSGKTRPTLTGKAFLNILKLIGTSPIELVGVDLVCVDDWFVEESEVAVMKAFSTAKKHTSSYGMTTVEEIRQALATPGNPLDPTDIRRVLTREPSVRWAGEWLWVEKDQDGTHANRLVNTARSILSVNSPQTVFSIHEGARRLWKFRGLDILPPTEAMRIFFDESPYFVVEGELVRPIKPLDYREVLGSTTATMVDVLKGSPYQVMDRLSLAEACSDAGIPKGTYGIWTTYAEWMERFGSNVWGLRGSSPHPGAVEAIRTAAKARQKAEPRRKSWSWAPDGRIAQTMDVTTSFLSSGVLSFVPEIQGLFAGQSLAISYEGKQVATAKLGDDHSFCWGWHPAIAAMGVNPGDVLRITVDVGAKRAELQVGGQEFWN